MIRVEVSREYPTTTAAAFDYITDPANWPDYWPDLIRVETPERSWAEPGDEMRLRMRFMRSEVVMQMALDRLVPAQVVEYHSRQDGMPELRHERHWEQRDNGFRYRIAVSYEPRPGAKGFFDRVLVRRGVKKALTRTLDNLESRLT
ncbi:SRPBCC family protein [Virgisporangium aliadipatigenens]|uniref:SRPBCC family protein n=1 Tax=Virgisporangium aliadipatigenens TaxID=741659 RepID=UPI001943C039|nr:SRPBCC family protein [Virgisporangium aliadipatigenens]